MSHDLIMLTKSLEDGLQKGALKQLKPYFELVGSMAERTRIGLANEMDLGLHFKVWKENIPFKVRDDPFSLKKAEETCPESMHQFFEGDVFQYHKFMRNTLIAIDATLRSIFEKRKNPPTIKQITSNQDWDNGETRCKGQCKKNLKELNFQQCLDCAVTVSQTKSGIVLQFLWERKEKKIFCSIDLIPVFPIQPVTTMFLVKLINTAMLFSDHPRGWLKYLFKYPTDYKIIEELTPKGKDEIHSVGLKTMNFNEGKNHHIKPAQVFTLEKFRSKEMRDIYSYIKFLKKVLNFNISSFWVKKELMKDQYLSIVESNENVDTALIQVLSQPEFRSKLKGKINFTLSNKNRFVHPSWVRKNSIFFFFMT